MCLGSSRVKRPGSLEFGSHSVSPAPFSVTTVRMKPIQLLNLCFLSLSPVSAFIGHGIAMYDPSCAFACRAVIASALLSCSEPQAHSGGHSHGSDPVTPPECRASDAPFLTTLAYCINSTCTPYEVSIWRLERYWVDKTTGDPTVLPRWSYSEALAQVDQPPAMEFTEDIETINATLAIPEEAWLADKLSMEYFEVQETLHARYG